MAYGEGDDLKVIANPIISTRYVAVKHGREACRFTFVDIRGNHIPYVVAGRGSREVIERIVREKVTAVDELLAPGALTNSDLRRFYLTFV